MSAAPTLDRYDWTEIHRQLDAEGWALLPALFNPDQARALACLFDDPGAPASADRASCRTLRAPLPAGLDALRQALHARLLPLARTWARRLGRDPAAFSPAPASLERLLVDGCLPLRHAQDDTAFPFCLTALLSEPGQDFTGGEFVMTEQRPRQQSRPQVLALGLGDGAVIAAAHRPIRGAQGDYRATLRHAVSRVRGGERRGLALPLGLPSVPADGGRRAHPQKSIDADSISVRGTPCEMVPYDATPDQ